MFGYVRPLPGELKVCEYEQFKAAYCGLCHTLTKRYGWAAQFLLNYDYIFLLLLLSNNEKTARLKRRCMARPFRGKCVCAQSGQSEYVADVTVVLTFWKLKDNMRDGTVFKTVKARVLALIFGRAYAKAKKRLSEFDTLVGRKIAELEILEKAKTASLDIPADKFALILSAAADRAEDAESRRILEQILYHTGRWIYIIDAYDDLKDDFKSGDYNPIRERFELSVPECPEDIKKEISLTLLHSLDMAASAFELLKDGLWTPVIGNIIYNGMPHVGRQVLLNNWKAKRRRQHE